MRIFSEVGRLSAGDETRELGSVLDAQFLEGVHDVGLDGAPGDVQLLTDLAIGEALRHERGNATFGRRQLRDRVL